MLKQGIVLLKAGVLYSLLPGVHFVRYFIYFIIFLTHFPLVTMFITYGLAAAAVPCSSRTLLKD